MGLRYRIPLPGPFYYSGRVGPKRRLPRSSNTGTGPMGFVVKWLIVYPCVVISGLVWLLCLLRSMGWFGWSVVRCGIAGGAGRSLSVSLFGGLCRSVRHGALPRGRMVSFRFSGSV